MKENKLERVIPICKKNTATAYEIVTGCGAVCKAYLDVGKEKLQQGLLSCSFVAEGGCLAICLWERKDDDRYKKAMHINILAEDLITLKGHVDRAITKNPSLHDNKEN